MIPTNVPTWAVSLIGFGCFALFLLVAFAVAYAKRDVEIRVTLLEYHR
jgi:hypothetical protein